MKTKTYIDVINHNAKVLAEGGPRLTYAYEMYVVARSADGARVMLGGLGVMGVGVMWFDKTASHEALPGYADAPLQAEEA